MADVCCKEFMKMVLVMAAERAVAEDWEDFQPVYERLLEGFSWCFDPSCAELVTDYIASKA